MGIGKRFKQLVKGKPEDPEVKAVREKAFREGRLERARKEGYAKGRGPTGKGGHGAGWLPAVAHSLSATEKAFGFRGSGSRLDEDINLGGTSMNILRGPEKTRTPPQRVTKVNPRTGTVTITEPAQHSINKKPKVAKTIWEQLDEDNPF